jgi:hypothetical protein
MRKRERVLAGFVKYPMMAFSFGSYGAGARHRTGAREMGATRWR